MKTTEYNEENEMNERKESNEMEEMTNTAISENQETSEEFTREEMKRNAVRNLLKIKCFPAYKEAFRRSNTITMYEGIGGYYVDEENEPELMEKIAEVEEKYGGMVYGVIHQRTEFGELYSMLWQTKWKEDDKYCVQEWNNVYYVHSYVWNKTDDWSSEFGDIGIVERFGGLIRVA